MLGYGSMVGTNNAAKAAITQKYLGLDGLSDNVNPLVFATPQTVNILPFLAYQKVYFDFYSDSQWEKHLAYAYNLDYWTGTSPITLVTDMLKLRYANYPKDYFMGILPSSQYGSVAVLPSLIANYGSNLAVASSSSSSTTSETAQLLNVENSSAITSSNKIDKLRYVRLNSDLSALSIRATEYLQRWKEVVQFSSKDYSDQMRAQFGIKAPEYMGNHWNFIVTGKQIGRAHV